MPNRLIMYARSVGCPSVSIARRVLQDQAILYEEIHIDQDPIAKERVIEWTGFNSVPTLVIAADDDVMPITPPDALEPGASPRGIDRGSMITEPNRTELEDWLAKHGLLVRTED